MVSPLMQESIPFKSLNDENRLSFWFTSESHRVKINREWRAAACKSNFFRMILIHIWHWLGLRSHNDHLVIHHNKRADESKRPCWTTSSPLKKTSYCVNQRLMKHRTDIWTKMHIDKRLLHGNYLWESSTECINHTLNTLKIKKIKTLIMSLC